MTITKAILIRQIHESHPDLTKNKSREAVETILRLMKDTLAGGEDILLSGFGKFNVKKKTARRGRNPLTGAAMMLPPRKVVTFKPSGSLRRKVNKG